jgi:hypothetical protein
MSYWAEPIATGDLDYVLGVDSDTEYMSAVFRIIGPESDGPELEGHGLIFGDTPVQFFPSTTRPIYADALENAAEKHIALPDGSTISTRVVRPEHLVLFGLESWRGKDRLRVQMLAEVANDEEVWCLIKKFDDADGTYAKRHQSLTR